MPKWNAIGSDCGCDCYGGGGTGTITLPFCDCFPIPATLTMDFSGTCDGVFNACTIVYGATPSEFSTLGLGASCFLSTDHFLDSFSGVYYRWFFGCDHAHFSISRVYESSPPIHDAPVFTWATFTAPNTCSPLSLTSGSIFSGGNPTCQVSIVGAP